MPRAGLLYWAGASLLLYLFTICLPDIFDNGRWAGGDAERSCDSETLDGGWGTTESHGVGEEATDVLAASVASVAAAAAAAAAVASEPADKGGDENVDALSSDRVVGQRESSEWAWPQLLWADTGTDESVRRDHADCDPADLRPLVARALRDAQQHGEEHAATTLQRSLAECLVEAQSTSAAGATAVGGARAVADPVEESATHEGAEAVTGWSVFWAVWLTILCLLAALLAVASSPRSARRRLRAGSRWLPLLTLVGAVTLWAVHIRPPLEHGLVPAVERMIERAEAFDKTIVVSADKAEFMRSEDAWLAGINSLNRGFRLEIDQMMDSSSSPQPTLMLLFFSLTAAAFYGVLVARAVQDVLPTSVSHWLEPASWPTVQVGWLIAIPTGSLVCWQFWVGYRVVASALKLAAVMRGHVTALHSLGEEVVAAAAAAGGENDAGGPALTWREASADLKVIVERLEGRRWGIKLAGFHMDDQFDAKFTSIFLKILVVAVGVVLPLVWSKSQINRQDRKRAQELEKHRKHVQEIQERYEGLVLADELNAEELTDFKSSHVLDGGQATLFEATYKDDTVAVKCMIDQDCVQREIWYDQQLAERQKRSSNGSSLADDDDDDAAVAAEQLEGVVSGPAASPDDEGEPPMGSNDDAASGQSVFSRVMSAGGTNTEAIGLAVCHHPNVLSYRGRVDPEKLKRNAEFRSAFRKYKGKIPDDDDDSHDSGGDSSANLGPTSSNEDVAAIRTVPRRGQQYQRQYRDWYFSSVLITPYCTGRSLHDALHSDGPYGLGGSGGRIGEARLLVAARSIVKGMKYLHERNLVHNDLKPKNILLDSVHWGLPPRMRADDTGSPTIPQPDWCCQHVKIGDFGLCVIGGGHGSGGQSEQNEGPVGTDPYMSPEMIAHPKTLQTDDQKKRCDVYSFGMLLLTMVLRREPWEEQLKRPGRDRVRQWVVEQETVQKGKKHPGSLHAEAGRPPIPREVDDGYRELIHRCWHHKPDERPVFEHVFSELRQVRSMLVLAREDYSGLMWEEKVFCRKKKPKNGVEQTPETDERHKQGIETLKSNGICTVDALHEAVYSAGVEQRRLASLSASEQQAAAGGLAEGVPPGGSSVAGLTQRNLDQVKKWLDKWQHHH
jgi:serine/threonine protein kinase